MEFVLSLITLIIVSTLIICNQERQVVKFEKEKLLPILDRLYRNPNSREKHQQFIQALGALDAKIKKYKEGWGNGYSYTPGKLITEKLLKHTSQKPQDILAHERVLEVLKRADSPSDLMLEGMLKHLAVYPQDRLAHQRLAICASKVQHLLQTDTDIINPLIDYLNTNPLNSGVQKIFMQCVTHIMLLSESERQRIYDTALEILQDNPASSTAKQFVLTIGRWHFGKSRKGGKPSIYDEQRIQNDILARVS
ncbi:hypothetical protein AFK68_23755 [Hydrocoleum sp. CS-953]|uniref:hypothetical protein n=1 Tax=Hydrocoleum sp. CS-953 TaxID=1671698 RepID=UPI000B9BBE12|nr:hypothetical protein [Hydrocoleum sp. CS-953]OZH52540.1 hypothetical protein AFK68_23755 [Hydrocoleum sp. CS-953]